VSAETRKSKTSAQMTRTERIKADLKTTADFRNKDNDKAICDYEVTMRFSRLFSVVAAMAMLVGGGATAFAAGGLCQSASFEGEAKAGQSFIQPLGNGMVFDLEAVRAGWIVRVLPVSGARPAHDAAELATPPYNSVTPLAITTDFSFRAQDALAWNPRRFQFAGDLSSFKKFEAAYTAFMANPNDAAAQEKMAEMAAAAPAAELQILDSRLVPGTANQAQMAAAVASHIEQTPHTVEQGSSPLGAVTWVKFRVTLHLPAGFVAAKGLATDRKGCR